MTTVTNVVSAAQERWKAEFERRHRIAPPQYRCTSINQPEVIMAQVIKLPARSNAIDYDEEAILDVYLSLVGDDDNEGAAKGEGVVIDEAQDSESKARVRCRTMGKLLADGRDAADDDDDDDGRYPIETRTHVVEQNGSYLPVLSLKV